MGVLSENAIIGASAAGGYDIDNSCRFNDGDSPKLDRTNDAPTNEKIWTWSGWVKKCSSTAHQTLMSGAKSGSTRQGYITFNVTHNHAIRFNYFNESDDRDGVAYENAVETCAFDFMDQVEAEYGLELCTELGIV